MSQGATLGVAVTMLISCIINCITNVIGPVNFEVSEQRLARALRFVLLT